MAKQEKAVFETQLHEDGAVSHKITFANGEKRLILVPRDHVHAQRLISVGSKAKFMAAINSVDTVEKAVEKVDALDTAWEKGDWGLQAESDGSARAGGLAKAIAELKGIPVDAASVIVAGLTRQQQADLRAEPRVAAILTRDAKKGSALLDGILGGGEAEGNAEEAA